MDRVREIVAHILLHVNAEAADRDPSQAGGVQERARLVRDTLRSLNADERELSLNDSLLAFRALVPTNTREASLRRALANIKERPQLAIQEWVSTNRETGS